MLPGSGVARQRILVSYLVIFWHILSYFHITVRNWRPQHINYDTKRVLANELETQNFVIVNAVYGSYPFIIVIFITES